MGFSSGDWLGHSMTLICFLFEPLPLLPWPYILGHCHVGRPSTTHFQCSHWGKEVVIQNFLVHGPIQPPLDMVKSSCPLNWETPPKHKVSTSMLHSGDGVIGVVLSISLLQTRRVELMPITLFWSHLTTSPSHKPPPDHLGVLWQTADVPSSAEEPCARSRILILHGVVCYWWFSSWLWSQLPSGH